MQVYNNINAFSVWKSYNHNVGAMRQSMEKLSSGQRIVRAEDDPAGLAMSERLRAQYRNTSKAASNVENKINYLQTADAWLQKIHDMMGRMSELAVMANDGTKSQIDRDNLQKEFKQMQQEIKRITSGATAAGKFNGLYLFRGGSGVPVLADDLVEGNTVGLFAVNRLAGGGALNDEYRAEYDFETRLWTLRNETADLELGQFSANPREGGSLVFTEGGTTFQLTVRPPSLGGYQDGARIDFSQSSLPPSHVSPVVFEGVATQGSGAVSASGSGAGISAAAWSMTYNGTQWVLRNETTQTTVQTINAQANAALSIPFVEGFNGFNIQINTPGGATCYSAGDRFTWTNTAGQVGTMRFHDSAFTAGGATATILGDGLSITDADYRATYDGVFQQWQVVNETTGVTVATMNANPFQGTSVNIEGASGVNFTIQVPGSGGYSHGDSFTWSNTGPTGEYRSHVRVSLQVGPDSNMVFRESEINLEAGNFAVIGSFNTYQYGSVNMTLLGSSPSSVRWGSLLSGQHLSISQQSVAQGAVDKLNLGIDYISSIRAVVGAEMKRMEETLDGLRGYEENARATESRIRDTDIAQETMQYSKYQILVQVGVAMMAQANALPQGVLQLLG